MYYTVDGFSLGLSQASNNTIGTATGNSKYGTIKNDLFHGSAGEWLYGGAGDDIYNLWSSSAVVSEIGGQGTDTVIVKYWGAAILADNVETLILDSAGAVAGTGNALNNLIMAGSVGATLDGRQGNDVLVGGAGGDVFKIAAGNGSDAIVNFTAGKDAIQLDGFGIASFSQLLSYGSQVGSDVIFRFDNGERLALRDVQLSTLSAPDFNLWSNESAAPGFAELEGAGKVATVNGWRIHNNTYNAADLQYGKDFFAETFYNPEDVTTNITFKWSFPLTTSLYSPIKAYPEIAYGFNPIGGVRNPTETTAVFPVKISALSALTTTYDVALGGNASGYNVAYDIWLTSTPYGDRASITNEIMVWVHKGDLNASGTVIGTYRDGDFSATVYHTGTYTAFVADGDVLTGKIDISKMIAYLQGLGIVSTEEYLSSIEFGAEVTSGTGSLTIRNFDISVDTLAGDGTRVHSDIDGTGTTVTEVRESSAPLAPSVEQVFDADGLAVGWKTTTYAASGDKSIDFKDNNGRFVGRDTVVHKPNGEVMTNHFDARSQFAGADNVVKNKDGSITTQHYDKTWKFAGADVVASNAKGQLTSHYDSRWQFTGADNIVRNNDGTTTTQHYDKGWKFIGAEVVTTTAKGGMSTDHYDAKWQFIGAEHSQTGGDGSVTTHHYDKGWKLTGTDIVTVNAAGHTVAQHYDGGWKLIATDIKGSVGGDTLVGNDLANIITGGAGNDVLTGKGGHDTFLFEGPLGPLDVDRMTDFSNTPGNDDTILLNRITFAALAAGALNATAFVSNTTGVAADQDDRIIYNSKTGDLFYDADGTGNMAAVKFAHLDNAAALSHLDFFIF